MRVVREFPHEVQTWEHVTIPMPDGVRLAAKIWMPTTAAERPVPAVLEYIPYRKRDGTAIRDHLTHPYLAGHGYACVRVDLRGCGDSEGVLTDEYTEQELSDGEQVLSWIAAQSWCSGSVGMMGISWGGFNALQLAARPGRLPDAIAIVAFSDDRFRDDIHYMGGCMLGENLSWASTMFAYMASPPDPLLVGENWRSMWQQRLEGSGFWLEPWLRHQTRDAYWRHASVCENYAAVRCPVFAVSGWADGYSNAVLRLMEHLQVPRLGLIGPWSHKYPHIGIPGPAYGFLQELVRWWGQWLKGEETGIMHEPQLRVWMQEHVPPSTGYDTRPGRWVAEDRWPSPNLRHQVLSLDHRYRLVERTDGQENAEFTLNSPLSLGLFSGKWCSESAPPDLPDDQREEDGGAVVFDTDPLEEPFEVLGAPELEVSLRSSKPVALLAVRLSSVQPDRRVTRISYGMLNLTRRCGMDRNAPLVPHETYRIRLQLNDIAQVFPAGNCLRLAFSNTYWPHVWPSPEPSTLTILTDRSRLLLPIREPQASDCHLAPAPEPEGAPPVQHRVIRPAEHSWKVIRDLGRAESALEVVKNAEIIEFPEIDWRFQSDAWERYQGGHDDLSSLRGETRWQRSFSRRGWWVRTDSYTRLTADSDNFYLHAELDAFEGDTRVFCKPCNTAH